MDSSKSVKFRWSFANFSMLNTKSYSEDFTAGGYKWRILIYPNNVTHLSIYLDVSENARLRYGWSRNADFSLTLVNQIDKKDSITKRTQHRFNALYQDWGVTSLIIPLSELRQPKRGYLKNDSIVVEVDVVVHKRKKAASSVADQSDARTANNGTKDLVLEPNISSVCDKQTGATDDILATGQQTINDLSGTSSSDRSVINQDKVDDKYTDTCFDVMATPLLEMLEDDKDLYSVRLHDFNDIASNKYVDVGIFTVPESLESYAKDILGRHADIGTGNSPVHYMNEMAFVVLCCVLKSMDTTHFGEINKSLILKWRDAIRGSSQFGFKVDFLKDHLKSVTQAYLAKLAKNCHEGKELQAIDVEISAKRKQLDSLMAQREDMYKKMNTKLRKICETAATKFQAELLNFCWLEINRTIDTTMLSPETLYKVVFVIMLKDPTSGLEVPVNIRLHLPNGNKQNHKEELMNKPRGQWIEIPAGEFRTSTDNVGKIGISLFEY